MNASPSSIRSSSLHITLARKFLNEMDWRSHSGHRISEGEAIMSISLPDARELSDEILQALRLRAVRGCELGFTEADVADLLGVSRETVSRWWSDRKSVV